MLLFGSLSYSVRLEIAIWISEVLDRSGSFGAMLPKQLQYLISGPGSFRARSIFQVPVASPSYRGRVISPDLVPFPKDVLLLHIFAMELKPPQGFESGATKGHPSGRR